MKLLHPFFRIDLVEIAKADTRADAEEVSKFVADMTKQGLYSEATEDDIERLDDLI